MSDLQVSGRRDADIGIVAVGGELRTEIAARVFDVARDLLDEGARHLVIDIARVHFMDSASLAVLLRLDGQVAAGGGRMVLAACSRPVLRVLDNSGLGDRFARADDQEGAVGMLR